MQLKNSSEIEKLRAANLIVKEVLDELESMVKPGITTLELNERALEITKKRKANSAFLNYPSPNEGTEPFSGVICASINEQIVHGIPNDTPLSEGDILSVDYGCELNGYFGDSARTIAVGEISDEATSLLAVTSQSLSLAIEQCQPGNRMGDLSNAVQVEVEKAGFGVVRDFVGHGIGRNMHEPPQVRNFGQPNQGQVMKPGLVIAIEPMVTIGSYETKLLDDGWTAVTKDGSLSAHFEHSVAITEDGPLILSL